MMRFDTSNGMESNAVNSLYIDSKGSLWAATRAGIVYISDTKNPKLKIYNHKQGLIDENVRSIIEDEKVLSGSVPMEELLNGKVMKRDF